MKIKTITRQIHTVEFDGEPLEVSSLPYSSESVLAERVGDTSIVVAYLVHDDDAVMDMGDCMGKLLSFHRHATTAGKLAGLRALGRDANGYRDEDLKPNQDAVVLDCYEHGGQMWSGAGVWVPDDCLREMLEAEQSVETRRAAAVTYCKQFLAEYNERLAGNVFGCVVEVFRLADGEWTATEHDACWDYVGYANAKETLKVEYFDPTVKGIKESIVSEEYDYYTMRRNSDGSVDVLGWGTYPEGSVLAGQSSKTFIDTYPDEESARAAYPNVTGFSSKWTEPQNTFNHLSDDGDY